LTNIWQSTRHNITEGLRGDSPQDLDLNPCIMSNLQEGGEKWEPSVRDSNKVLPDRKRVDMTLRHLLCHKRQQKRKCWGHAWRLLRDTSLVLFVVEVVKGSPSRSKRYQPQLGT
jgi:hypothetical protein